MGLLVLLGLTVVGFLGTLVAVNVAYIRHLEAKDRRHDEQVARLCQRLQAPELAVIEHAQAQVTPDNDGLPLTDEQIAAEQERAAALRQIEEIEADFAGRKL